MVAGGVTKARELDQTPTWAVAAVCAVIVLISIILEKVIHRVGELFQEKRKNALFEALEKIKGELMVLGFISLILTFGQNYIASICIPLKAANTMLPCPYKGKPHHEPERGPGKGEEEPHHRRLLWNERRFLAGMLLSTVLQNAFEITYFLWIWYEFGLRSCFHENFDLIIVRVALGVGVQFLCSYITLPLYALVTQMGSNMKKSIFDEQTSKALKKWHMNALKKKEGRTGRSPTRTLGGSPGDSPVHSPSHAQPHFKNTGHPNQQVSDVEADTSTPRQNANVMTDIELQGNQRPSDLLTGPRSAILISTLPFTVISLPQPSEAREKRNRKAVPLEDYLTTSDGLKYYDVLKGNGPAAEKGSLVQVHFDCMYRGITAISSRESKLLAGNRSIAQAYEFKVGAPPGKERKREFVDNPNGLFSAQASPKPPPALYSITEGMKVGGKRTVIVPPEAGYGQKGMNEIPPGATFELNIELLQVVPPEGKQPV
ncbi:hypothetical protein L1049_026672 [Liquidambar formosana]|uniref:MLO-like protein n=1 Tax=Liquidambar formosana TaxID=63359 RepID=A0AAP0NDU1_LIQFO